ncbi:MAG: tryptophan synthase subunit alpha [Chitinophagaceae bacterium]
MLNKLEQVFIHKTNRVLNVYCTAGYPLLQSTNTIINSLQKNGADIIELGIPYSDPLADGPTIQESSMQAIENGMTIEVLFAQLEKNEGIKNNKTALILMGYLNPVLLFGFEKFCAKAKEVGVDGLILPDMPAYEFETTYKAIVDKYGLNFIFLVTPETSEARVKMLDNLSSGFLYAVSSSSITGSDKDFNSVTAYLQRLQSYQLKNKILVGFGIKDKQTFNLACAHSNGAIIGSAYIKALQQSTDIETTTSQFIKQILL